MSTLNTTNIKHPSSASNNIVLDSSARVLVGTSTSRTWSGVTSQIQLEGAATLVSQSIVANSADQVGGLLAIGKSRGTSLGSNTVVQSGDLLGQIYFIGADGSNFIQAATIKAEVDGTPGANDMPGRLVFSTTADGASSPMERMRIRANGNTSMSGGLAVGNNTIDTAYFYLGNLQSGAGNSTLKWNTSTGFVTYDTSSRLVKTNIEDCPYGLAELVQLKPRKYFRTDDQKAEIGFVADEVIEVLPEFVPTGPKSIITKNEADTEEIPLGVSYEKLTAVLTKALQEAIGEIESLKARVAALEAA